MKLLLEQLLVEAGAGIRLHTRVVGAAKDEKNRLMAVLTESKSGREAWLGRVFVDCTGDGRGRKDKHTAGEPAAESVDVP